MTCPHQVALIMAQLLAQARTYTSPTNANGSCTIWPPRRGKPPSVGPGFYPARECLARSGAPRGWTYNITFEPPCIVRARAEVKKKQYPMIIDICRMWELIDLFRQQQLNPVSSVTEPEVSCDQTVPFWDGRPLAPYWHEVHHACIHPELWEKASRSADAMKLRASRINWAAPSYGSCAVVGGAPFLLGAGHGAAIDAKDAVFRFNDHPIGGTFKNDIGERVTVHLLQNAKSIHASKFRGTADMIVQIVCKHAAALDVAMKMTVSNSSSAIRLLSPQLLLAFAQIFNDAGGELPAHNAHTSSIVVFYCRHWSFWSVVVVICMPRTTYTLWLLHPR